MNVTRLYCSSCSNDYAPGKLYNLCSCGKPLLVEYDLDKAQASLAPESLRGRVCSLWRYREVLPVEDAANIVTLGEGMTPLLKTERLALYLGMRHLFIK